MAKASLVAQDGDRMQEIPMPQHKQHVPTSFIGKVVVVSLLTIAYFYAGKRPLLFQ
jgi:hypothetical protein